MANARALVEEQFDNMAQQNEAARLGMWSFLATEILFFGGLFMAYLVYRATYPAAFALGSQQTNVVFGTINTAILLTSSLTMALAVHAVQENKIKQLVRYLLATIVFALGFLGVKALEYHEDFAEHLVPGPSFALVNTPHTQLFFWLYWAMTGLHAIHVFVGVVLLSIIAWLARRGRFSDRSHNAVENAGLYWHFVDLVWVYLYPLLYLIDRFAK